MQDSQIEIAQHAAQGDRAITGSGPAKERIPSFPAHDLEQVHDNGVRRDAVVELGVLGQKSLDNGDL